MNLYLLKYKNYYNRQATRYVNITDYLRKAQIWTIEYDYDFNPNDGIWASVIVNTEFTNIDYLIVYDPDVDEIQSRWYILESTRRRAGQYQLKLLRDVIADYYDDVLRAPTFIEKATVKYGNPLLFNQEDMTFNQIKTNEIALKDRSICPWIIGYVDRKTEGKTISVPRRGSYSEEYASIKDLPFYSSNGKVKITKEDSFNVTIGYTAPIGIYGYTSKFNKAGSVAHTKSTSTFDRYVAIVTAGDYQLNPDDAWSAVAKQGSEYISQNLQLLNDCVVDTTGRRSESELNEFLAQYSTQPKTVKIGNALYNVRRDDGVATTIKINPAKGTELYDYINNMVAGMDCIGRMTSIYLDFSNNYMFEYTEIAYSLFVELAPTTASYQVSIPSNRRHLEDAPYDMFCIPYNITSRLQVGYLDDGIYGRTIPNCDPEGSISIATRIASELGAGLYDLQLLPYCPIQDIIDTVGSIAYDTSKYIDNVDVEYIYDTTIDSGDPAQVSIMFWCSSSEFSLNIDKTHEQTPTGYLNYPIDINVDAADAKVQALCDMHRLVSPNYASQFEFNVVKNNGVEFFTVDCTYKPYSPYIRVAPNFGGLYGREFDDARGLILGGDFSLPTINDQWKQYEINNKNYLNAFDRQIDNLEVQQKYQRLSEIVGATVGTASAAITGGMTGALIGGGYGAAIGGAGSAVLSGAGGLIDISINDKLRTEALDYTKDMFGYQLGNIKAMPNTLNKVSAFNINNKIFPILEYYTCTEIEKQALRDKIKYNGMTVQTIGTVAQYIQNEPTYIKGRIIRLEDIGEDYHMAVAIAEELYKGVFI